MRIPPHQVQLPGPDEVEVLEPPVHFQGAGERSVNPARGAEDVVVLGRVQLDSRGGGIGLLMLLKADQLNALRQALQGGLDRRLAWEGPCT